MAEHLESVRRELIASLGEDAVVSEPAQRRAYDSDGLTAHRATPGLVVLPRDAGQVATVVRTCVRYGVPYVARGAGTGLSGGATPHPEGVLIALARMKRIVSIDPDAMVAVVEPGVTNLAISRAAAPYQLYYAPDPSSQIVCTIGGNVAENSGGAHCLKHGFTVNHVLALDVVLPDGEQVTLGSGDLGAACRETPGYDLRGVFVGSEGTLGIATRVAVRLLRIPQRVVTLVADYTGEDGVAAACDTVSAVIAAGIVPAAVEMMDNLSITACEEAVHAGYDTNAAALLIVELDGPQAECETLIKRVQRMCASHGSTRVRVAADERERALIWRGRKAAFAAVGQISPNFEVQDGVVPRTRLTEALAGIAELSGRAGLRVANVFHAGDGNLHPLVLYSETAGETERASRLATEIAEYCVELGGSLSGEHGIGIDKACSMPRMFSADDLELMARLRAAFDPLGLCNPGKVLPTPRLCGEKPGPYRPTALEEAGVAQRW